MGLLKKLTALGLSCALAFSYIPASNSNAAVLDKETVGTEMSFDYKTGESVTYYALGKSGSTVNDLLKEQWALYNDGSFNVNTANSGYDFYDDPFGSPNSSDLWSDPFMDLFNGWGYYFGFASRGRNDYDSSKQNKAVAGVDININEAYKLYNANKSNKEVIVAVIDTGVDYTHEDLDGSIWVNEDEIPGNGIDDDGNGYVDDVNGWNFYDNSNVIYTGRNDDHGTHCAGTIAAQTDNGKGIASITGGSNVKIMVLKALGGYSGSGETLSVVQAIKYAEANGASIVNLSLGSSYSDELLYNTIASSKMLFVVASGNGDSFYGRGLNTDKNPCYPASYDLDNIISVANISYTGSLDSSSNYGEKSVDIAAPGTDIISTTPKNGYGYMTGTSMAAPFVSGAAALVYSYYDGITLSDVKEILIGSAKRLDSLKGKMVSDGMLDVGSALSYDTKSLSHKEFSGKKSKGSAPVLTFEAYKQNNRLYLDITATDADNDIYVLLYQDDEKKASDFNFGATGTEFNLKRGSKASFVSSDLGTYTFYALDSEGHETVLVVDLSKADIEERTGSDNDQPGYNNGNYRDWYGDRNGYPGNGGNSDDGSDDGSGWGYGSDWDFSSDWINEWFSDWGSDFGYDWGSDIGFDWGSDFGFDWGSGSDRNSGSDGNSGSDRDYGYDWGWTNGRGSRRA